MNKHSLTLQYHNNLNKKLWNGFKLKPEVLEKLLEIAEVWRKYADIPKKAVLDIIVVGGNANFNYTEHSDIDLHLYVNMDKISSCHSLIDEYLDDKKQLWSNIHNITIYGHDIELYAHDKSEKFQKDQGVYSLINNKWLIKPRKVEVDLNSPLLHKKIMIFKSRIDNLININANDSSFDTMRDKIKKMRASGLKRAGEFSYENLAFKELRNSGYLEKMNDYVISRMDKQLSLEGRQLILNYIESAIFNRNEQEII